MNLVKILDENFGVGFYPIRKLGRKIKGYEGRDISSEVVIVESPKMKIFFLRGFYEAELALMKNNEDNRVCELNNSAFVYEGGNCFHSNLFNPFHIRLIDCSDVSINPSDLCEYERLFGV